MTLTPEQITQMNQITGMNKPVTPQQGGAQSRIAELRAIAEKARPTATPAFPVNNPLENIRTGKSEDNLDVGKGAMKKVLFDASSAGAQNAGPVGAEMRKAAPDFSKNLDSLSEVTNLKKPKQEEGALNTSVAEFAGPLIEPTVKVASKLATKSAAAIKDVVKTAPEDAIKIQKQDAAREVGNVFDEISKKIQDTTDALHVDKTGKKLDAAYARTVSGKTQVVPKSIFQEQGLTPDEQTVNLATRLKDIGLGKDHVQNLKILEKELTDTEAKLSEALKGEDPEIIYNADKPTLYGKLNSAKVPREISTIKESNLMYRNVMNFAKEQVLKADDTIEGLRDARSAFDAQAKIEYKNAFKEGGVDLSTPAGRAIREARDIMNEHLYNTAPNGSEVQRLIGREADIFRATDKIAPQAAEGHGQNTLTQLIEQHPRLARYLGYGVALFTGGTVAHELGL